MFFEIYDKDLSKITVTDIITRADLNRATFYAHYPDVLGVTEEIENEIIEKMLDILKEFQFTNFFRNPPLSCSKSAGTWKRIQTFIVFLSVQTDRKYLWRS